MRISQTYDDNIYLAQEKQKEYITKISPSILFFVNSKYIAFDANYVMDYTRYKYRKDLGGLSHLFMTYIRPGSIPIFKKRGGKIGLEVQNDFQPMVTNVASSEQTERTERSANNLFIALDYYMSEKRTLSLEYKNMYQNYRSSTAKGYSYDESVILPTFYFHVRPKWSLFTGVGLGAITYLQQAQAAGSDSTYSLMRVGITGRVLNKVLARMEIGQEWRTYKAGPAGNFGSVSRGYFHTAFLDNITPDTNAALQFDHTIEESTYANNPFFVSNTISLNVEHRFTYKTSGLAGITLISNSYDKETTQDGETDLRADTLLKPHLGMKYYIKRWLSADLDYLYTKRMSNFKSLNYTDNRITAGLNAKF